MSALADLYLKKDVLKTLIETLEKKGENGIAITISLNDETNQYGQNVSAFVSQSKEQREANKPKYYVGNGKVFWTDGVVKKAEAPQPQGAEASNINPAGADDGLPF